MAVSYGATFISTSAIVGFGGMAALYGMGLLWLVFLNIFVGIFIAFILFGNRTRLMGYHLDAHTFPEFLGKRYQSKFIQVFSGATIFTGMSLYAAAVLIGGARFIEINMQLPYLAALWIFTVIIAAYVIAGGLKGVLYTDALQGTIMFLGMLILLIYAYTSLGGVVEAHQALTDLAAAGAGETGGFGPCRLDRDAHFRHPLVVHPGDHDHHGGGDRGAGPAATGGALHDGQEPA